MSPSVISFFYILCYVIAGLVIYLLMNDINSFNPALYKLTFLKLWLKMYALLTIAFIHSTWFFCTVFLQYNDTYSFTGLPFAALMTAYIILILSLTVPDPVFNISSKVQGWISWIPGKLGEKVEEKTESSETAMYLKRIRFVNTFVNVLIFMYVLSLIFFLMISNSCKKDLIIKTRDFAKSISYLAKTSLKKE